ncbi:MAG: class I SAM-dependent methyltransferase [Acidimicrobiia bacterium]|mgnify:CR=1 FL=1|nr:class I SAM-dependent methyltransferase [Acidimicrobiia bacterium]
MHPAAAAWIAAQVEGRGPWDGSRILDIGGRNVNGSALDEFVGHDIETHVIDVTPGPGVTLVADGRTWTPTHAFHAVTCTEVLEHVQGWPAVLWTCWQALQPDGLLIVTAAGPGRQPHSAVDGLGLRGGEWYRNVQPACLADVLDACGFADIEVDTSVPGDVYATARK